MPSTDEPVAYRAKLDAIQQADTARFKALQQADQERRGIIEDILSKYSSLLEDHENLQIDFNVLQKTHRSMYKESQMKDRELAEIKLEQVCPSRMAGYAVPSRVVDYSLLEALLCTEPPLVIRVVLIMPK